VLIFAASFSAHSSRAMLPIELRGRSELYSIRYSSMTLRACAMVMNQCSFKH
jgi:hypothetical protein